MKGNMDIALSSRVRLARNINGIPFPNRMGEQDNLKLIDTVTKAAPKELMLMRMDTLPMRERMMLVERHLISPDLARHGTGAALINREETVSILIGEEDHLRIQCIEPGLNLSTAHEHCAKLDMSLPLDYAFDAKLGYLTACPTNLGSAMRASVMLHLPALSLMGQTDALILALGKLGCTVRGFYGEGSGAPGHIYQLSNQVTLGISEEEITAALNDTVQRVIERETAMRAPLYKRNGPELEDTVYRSLGTMLFAHKLSAKEAMEYISNIKLGASLGLLPNEAHTVCNGLITGIQGASVEQRAGAELSPGQRDKARAEYVRNEAKALEEMYNQMKK